MVNTVGRELVRPADRGHGLLFYCPCEHCQYAQPSHKWLGWKSASSVLVHVRKAKKAEQAAASTQGQAAGTPPHSGLPLLCSVQHEPKYSCAEERQEARRASDRKRRRPARGTAPSTNLEPDPARVLLASAVDAQDKARAIETLNKLVQMSPEVLPDRDNYTLSCRGCNVELRIVNWQGRCVHCKQEDAEIESMVTRTQAKKLSDFMIGSPTEAFPQASLLDLEDHTPVIIMGYWQDFEPCSPQRFVEGLQRKSLKNASEDLTLWAQVKELLRLGEYVTLNYYPLDDSAVNALLQKRMGPRWVSWYGADLDLRMTVLILICLNPSRDLQIGTPFHIDRTQAENIAFATRLADLEQVLATWIFIPPSSLDKVEAWCRQQGKTLRDEVRLDLSLSQHRALRRQWKAEVVQQYHGQIVQVPAGWMHAVLNRRPCLKVAYEYAEMDKTWLYPLVSKLIGAYIGERAAEDYMPIFTCAFNCAMQS